MEDPKIEVEETSELPAGVPEGTVLETTDEDGNTVKEVVVHDLDEDGNVIGFHKEVSK